MIIKEAYVFLEILIYIDSEKISKFRDYWRASRDILDHVSIINRYINLRWSPPTTAIPSSTAISTIAIFKFD
jgi:hypothetical protein